MLQTVRRSLLEKLPEDAHLRATGKLFVSLTRLADGGNVLVSKFDTREELIQVEQKLIKPSRHCIIDCKTRIRITWIAAHEVV